jgi:hypothetical protein
MRFSVGRAAIAFLSPLFPRSAASIAGVTLEGRSNETWTAGAPT